MSSWDYLFGGIRQPTKNVTDWISSTLDKQWIIRVICVTEARAFSNCHSETDTVSRYIGREGICIFYNGTYFV